jgi:uncharacterized membrane protein YhhN
MPWPACAQYRTEGTTRPDNTAMRRAFRRAGALVLAYGVLRRRRDQGRLWTVAGLAASR